MPHTIQSHTIQSHTIRSLRRQLRDALAGADKPDADFEAREIVARALDMDAAQLVANGSQAVPPSQAGEILATLGRRLAGEPLDHILGEREFFGRPFHITADVLSPREDTEVLVRRALERLDGVASPRILDLGTGSGAIAVTLLAERPDATALGVDISPYALLVAERNAEAHGVADRLDLAQGSWFDDVEGRYDALVSNPPYITDAAMRELATEVADYDPALALAGGKDGLDAYRTIIGEALDHLQPGAPVVLEIGYDLGAPVAAMMEVAGFDGVAVGRDLAGHDRIVEATAPAARNPTHRHG